VLDLQVTLLRVELAISTHIVSKLKATSTTLEGDGPEY